nr:T-complex protein 1 subunit beta [Tanacetum cinerariifolium]
MISYLTKSDASEGFDQIIDFLNASSIKYALTVNDVTRLQALVDKKKVIITEATIRDALRLDDAESIDCRPNKEIFTELSRMGMSLVPLWLHLSSAFLQVESLIFLSAADVNIVLTVVDEPPIPSPTPPTQPPQCQDQPSTSQVQPTPPPSPITQPPSPQQQPQSLQDAEISIDLLHNLLDICTTLTRRVENLEQDKIAQALEIANAERVDTSDDTVMDDVSKQGRIIADMDADKDVTLKDVVDIAKEVVVDAEIEVLSMQNDKVEPAELQEVVEVVTTAKLITEMVTATSATITAVAPTFTTVAAPTLTIVAPTLTIAAALILTISPSAARRRKGVVIRDLEETATPSTIIQSEAKSKDKEKGILVEEPKPLKKQAQIKQDEAFARELEAELNKTNNWDDVIDQVQRKEKEDNVVMSWIPLIYILSMRRLKDFLKMKLPKRRVNVKTILGPKGMDKILQSTGRGHSVTVTNDGATILKSLHIDNPAAKVLIDISKIQDDEVGDWTTSVVVLAENDNNFRLKDFLKMKLPKRRVNVLEWGRNERDFYSGSVRIPLASSKQTIVIPDNKYFLSDPNQEL